MKRTRRLCRLIRLLALVVWLSAASPALCCPTCSAALAANRSASGGDAAAGFAYGIYLLLPMPFVVLGSIGMLLFREGLFQPPVERSCAAKDRS